MSRSLDSSIKRLFGHVQSKHLLAGSFGLILLATMLITALWLSRSGDRLVNDTMAQLAASTQKQLQQDFDTYIEMPDKINQQTADAIKAGRVDSTSPTDLARFAYDSPWRLEGGAVSGIFFGAPDGEFTGMGVESAAARDEWVFLRASPTQTEGRLRTIPATPDGSLGGGESTGIVFDPRKRPWYEPAVVAGGNSVWTDVYANADDGEPSLTRSRALYNESGQLLGVSGVDVFFAHMQEFLEAQTIGKTGEVFVYNGSAVMLAAHAADGDAQPFVAFQPLVEGQLPFARAASDHVREHIGGFTQLQEPVYEQVTLDGEEGYLFVGPLCREQGLDWSLGVFLPRSDYQSPSLLRLLPLLLLMTAVIWLSMTVFIYLIVKPLLQLRASAHRIASGDFDTRIDVDCTNEIGQLAQAVDTMRLSLKSSFANLSHQKRRAESTLHAIADGVITVDGHGKLLYLNSAAARLTGVAFEEALGQPLERVFHAIGAPGELPMSTRALLDLRHHHRRQARELTLLGLDDVQMPVHCRVSMVEHTDLEHARIVIVFRDLSEERRLESELLRHATHDELTGLVNRREFRGRLGVAIESARRRDLSHAVCYIDLDRFKMVNDTCGHAAGDELLKRIAGLFKETLRSGDTIARLGGDEFGVLLENCEMEQATRVMRKLHDRMAGYRFHWQDHGFSIGISSGLALIDQSVSTAGEVLRNADSACYCAKESGRNQLRVYTENDVKLSERRGELQWLEVLERALDNDGFLLYAQRISRSDPVSHSASHSASHFEVLLRMPDAHGGIVLPGQFLPAAERYGLVGRIDRWVVNQTLEWLAGRPDLMSSIELCSINLSGQSVGDPDFQDFLLNAIDAWQVPAQYLCFEITETASIANLALATLLIRKLKARGCRFALDDFGSGLSSFAYLKSLPVDYLKIDGMFVRDIGANSMDLAMVRSINEVGHTMGMETIAEFVETPAVAERLRELKVDFLQGYDIGLPMPIDDFFSATHVDANSKTGT